MIDVPVGTIILWAGDQIPDGWLPCNGPSADADSSGVPDLRGRFARCVDEPRTNPVDPDQSFRTDDKGNQIGPVVESVQTDQYQSHLHIYGDFPATVHDWMIATGSDVIGFSSEATNTTTVGVSVDKVPVETRPPNIYLYYIIKVT